MNDLPKELYDTLSADTSQPNPHSKMPKTYFPRNFEVCADFPKAELLSRPHLWICEHQHEYKLFLDKLRYIETADRKLLLHYGNETIYYSRKLCDFQKDLPKYFFRCNHSYIVNAYYIEKIEPDINRYQLTLFTGETLPLSRNKKKELKQLLCTCNI